LVDRAISLASTHSSASDLVWAQEQRALAASEPALAIDAWLEAARTADLKLHDREQANTCLRRALTLTEHAQDRAPQLLALAAELDAARPELGREDARRTLLRAHLELAEQASPEFRTQLVLGAARFATESLEDERTGFDVLRGGSALPPFSEALLDALETTAVRIHRLDALDAQLARSAERTEAVGDKQRLLTRRARVLTEQLARHDQAAQVYERLVELAPDDPVTAALHLECLRKAGRHRELLRACERRLTRVHEAEAKLALMREMATIWEVELKNRASALAIWNDVHALEPRDEEAARAVERLQRLDAP
jgi:tetratricopeptide (TPR) repeat protein